MLSSAQKCLCRTSFNLAGNSVSNITKSSISRFSTRQSWKRGHKDSKVPKVASDVSVTVDDALAADGALAEEKVQIPEFQVLLRQLYRKSHPDLLRASHPEAAETNDVSMQLLNGILTTIKKYNQYPAQIVKTIPFHVKSGDQVIVINLKIQTAGGDCKKALTGSFRDFFFEIGIINSKVGQQFQWGKGYFPSVPGEFDEEETEKKEEE